MSEEIADGCRCHVTPEIQLLLKNRPSIHVLFKGAFLQSPISLENGAIFVPFRGIGMLMEAYRVGQHMKILGCNVQKRLVEDLAMLSKDAEPVVVAAFPFHCENIADASAEIEVAVSHYKAVLSWAASSPAVEFARVWNYCGETKIGGALSWYKREKWFRCSDDNTGSNFSRQVEAVLEKCQSNQRFAFALSLYNYAQNESDFVFKIAKLYMCLESLSTLEATGLQTRDAIRKATNLPAGKLTELRSGDDMLYCDLLFGASEIRNHLFHGRPFDGEVFAKSSRDDTFKALAKEPEAYACKLASYCESLVRNIANTWSVVKLREG